MPRPSTHPFSLRTALLFVVVVVVVLSASSASTHTSLGRLRPPPMVSTSAFASVESSPPRAISSSWIESTGGLRRDLIRRPFRRRSSPPSSSSLVDFVHRPSLFRRRANHPPSSVAGLAAASSTTISYDPGDRVVYTAEDGSERVGSVVERRGGGWYSIKVTDGDGGGAETAVVVKRRGAQLSPSLERAADDSIADSPSGSGELRLSPSSDDTPHPPPIDNLDVTLDRHSGLSDLSDSADVNDDIDYSRTLLDQAAHHSTVKKWILLSDLHCSSSTLDASLAALKFAREAAVERGAGVIFLGDFWHRRGTVRVDVLNAVLGELREWGGSDDGDDHDGIQDGVNGDGNDKILGVNGEGGGRGGGGVPMIMIPGNHDQVTLGGEEHGLTMLGNAYRVADRRRGGRTTETQTQPQSHPGPLIFTRPTKFMGALFVPYIRKPSLLAAVLSSSIARTCGAHFVHADVRGAVMNDRIVSVGGVDPSSFFFEANGDDGDGVVDGDVGGGKWDDSNARHVGERRTRNRRLVYSGHYHKPHTVQSPKKRRRILASDGEEQEGAAADDDGEMAAAAAAAASTGIRYVGSPYQVSLNEAGQRKSLLVVDASRGWECVEELPIRVGRRHFRVNGVEGLLGLGEAKRRGSGSDDEESEMNGQKHREEDEDDSPGKGDRVVITVPRSELEEHRLFHVNASSSERVDGGDANDAAGGPSPFDARVVALRELGASVEVRETRPPPADLMAAPVDYLERDDTHSDDGLAAGVGAEADAESEATPLPVVTEAAEDMSPLRTFEAYLSLEAERGVLSDAMAASLLEAGRALLERLEHAPGDDETKRRATVSSGAQSHCRAARLELHNVTLSGLGPFPPSPSVTYPLRDRGLVLLRGINLDLEGANGGGLNGGTASSFGNGSGKTSLAMAAMWCLTGSYDARPAGDGRVGDVVHDGAKSASATVHGAIDSVPFVVARTKGPSARSGGSLTFHLDGADMTRQSVRDTQSEIYAALGDISPSVLSRTVFHGQHGLPRGLLEATDAELKEELSLVVPLEVWREGASLARTDGREHGRRESELEGMVQMRNGDVESVRRKAEAAQEEAQKRAGALREKEAEVRADDLEREKRRSLSTAVVADKQEEQGLDGDETFSVESCQQLLDEASNQVQAVEASMRNALSERDAEFDAVRSDLDKKAALVRELQEKVASARRSMDQAEVRLEAATEAMDGLRRQWDIDVASNGGIAFVALPDICPTCNQPIANKGTGHSHRGMKEKIETQFVAASRRIEEAEADMATSKNEYEARSVDLSAAETQITSAAARLKEAELGWDEILTELNDKLAEAREAQSVRSSDLQRASRQAQLSAEAEAAEARSEAELGRLRDAARAAETTHQSLRDELSKLDEAVRDLEAERAGATEHSALMSALADVLGPRGVPTYVLENAVHALGFCAQSFLDELSDGTMRLDLELDAGDRIARAVAVRGADGTWQERSLSSLSGGQWRRCSLALSLGFSDLVARRGRLRPSLLVLDEPLTHLDASGRAHVGAILRKMVSNQPAEYNRGNSDISTILIILQDLAAEELEESFDCIDQVVKEGGMSTVRVEND